MTIGKNAFQVLAVALCLVLVISIISCSNRSDNDALEVLKNMQSMQTTEVEETEPARDNVQKYRIIISADASDALLGKAIELSSAVTQKTGKACTVVRDTDAVAENDDTMEIQIGYVDRKEAREAMGRLNKDDSLCMRFSDSIILGGKMEGTSLGAVDKFISEILPHAEGKTVMNDDDGFCETASYELSSIMLCDVGFGNYGIVCDAQTREIAKSFREIFSDKCGAYADISNEPRDGVREIVFKISNSAQSGFCSIYRQNEDVLIESDSIYGLSFAVCRLYSIMLDSVKDGKGQINISYPLVYSCEATDLSVMSAVIDGSEFSALSGVLSQLDIASTDVMTVGSVTKESWMISKAHIPANYSYKLYTLKDGKYFPIIYNNESFDDVYVDISETEQSVFVSIGVGEGEASWITVYERAADGRQATVDAMLDKVSGASCGAVATYIGASGAVAELRAAHEGCTTEYLSCVGEGDNARNVLAVVTDKIIDCNNIYAKTIGEQEAFCVFSAVSSVYCAEYLALTT